MGEEGDGRGPARPEYFRLIKIAIVAAIVIVALVIAVPIVQDVLGQPRITYIEASISRVPCGLFGTSQNYTYTFTLKNSGDADGEADVHFVIDGTARIEAREPAGGQDMHYIVPAGSIVSKSFNYQVGGCGAHTTDILLVSFLKA